MLQTCPSHGACMCLTPQGVHVGMLRNSMASTKDSKWAVAMMHPIECTMLQDRPAEGISKQSYVEAVLNGLHDFSKQPLRLSPGRSASNAEGIEVRLLLSIDRRESAAAALHTVCRDPALLLPLLLSCCCESISSTGCSTGLLCAVPWRANIGPSLFRTYA